MHRNNLDDQNQNNKRISTIFNSNRESQKIWRDEKILQMASEGYSQEDIGAALQLTQPTTSKAISLSLLAMHDS